MTNADKYLRDAVSIEELITTMENELPLSYVDAAQFWKKTIKPPLTEDERVILRNIDKRYKLICRDNAYNLFVKNGTYDLEMINPLNKLFQFIKERRRIRNSRTFERRIKMFWIVFFACIGILTTICLLIIAGIQIKESEYFDKHRLEFYSIAIMIFISLALTITLGKPIAEKIFEKEMQNGEEYSIEEFLK